MGIPTPDRHANPAIIVRLPPDTRDALKASLDERGLEMQAFFLACTLMLVNNPEQFLARLAERWPPRKRGRPRKKDEQ